MWHFLKILRQQRLHVPLTISCLVMLLWSFPAVRGAEDVFSRQLEFRVRALLKREPELDSRLKIFAFDDRTAARERSQEGVSLLDWAGVARVLAANSPSRIIFDKVFSFGDREPSVNDAFVRELRALNVPIAAGVFASAHVIPERPPVEPDWHCREPQTYGSFQDLKFYGPAPEILHAFSFLGNTVIDEKGRFPVTSTRPDGRCFPPLALATDKETLQWGDGFLRVGRSVAGLDSSGALQPDVISREKYYSRTVSLKGVFQAARSGASVSVVNPGDTVVILPSLYTGNADFRRTPLGEMEGGFLHVANLNSQLRGHWLHMHGYGPESFLILFAAIVCGWALARCFRPLVAVGVGTFCTAAGAVLGLAMFVLFGGMVLWLLPSSLLLGTVLTCLAVQANALERHARQVSMALEGFVPRRVLQMLSRDPRSLQLAPRRMDVAVMFIDIEGFSRRFEGTLPDKVFASLREQLAVVADIIHDYGGTIDRTLGDGLLAFFGHSWEVCASSPPEGSATQALECAIAIQREWIRRTLEWAHGASLGGPPGERPLPLRIGIANGTVYWGDLGTGERLDFTIVGDAVNFAKRLEEASHPFRVMVSTELLALFERRNPLQALSEQGIVLRKCLLQIKHRPELLEAWECDPVGSQDAELRTALRTLNVPADRRSRRAVWTAGTPCQILVNGTHTGTLVDFSTSGLAFNGDFTFARKVHLALEIGVNIPALRHRLDAAGLSTLVGEVRWTNAGAQGSRHGIQFENLDKGHRGRLWEILEEFLRETPDSHLLP